MTRSKLLAELLVERYGQRSTVERERPKYATLAEIRRRQRVLCGDDGPGRKATSGQPSTVDAEVTR